MMFGRQYVRSFSHFHNHTSPAFHTVRNIHSFLTPCSMHAGTSPRSLLQLLKRDGSNNDRQQKAAACRVTGADGDCCEEEEMEMEMVNMKLYLENRCIMEENQRLRKKALALRQENQILLTQLHHHGFQFSVLHDNQNSEVVDVGDVSSGAGEQLPANQHQHHKQQQPPHGPTQPPMRGPDH